MTKQMKKYVLMAVYAIIAMVGVVSCSSDNNVTEDDVYMYFWKAEYLDYQIKDNNLGITPQKLEDDVTSSLSSFNEALNKDGGSKNFSSTSLQAAVASCKQKWQQKGWYSYIQYIKFNIGVFDTMSQRLTTYFTWEIGTDVDAAQ